jgi:hypothetical protein
MPLDASGTYRHNHESAAMHSKQDGKEYMPKEPANAESGDAHELHDHGDGTFHTVHEGEKTEHETLGHALIHMAGKHAEEGHTHFHGHHDGMMHRSHSVKAGGEPESQDHEDAQGMHDHMSEAMEDSPTDTMDEKEPAGAGLGGLY